MTFTQRDIYYIYDSPVPYKDLRLAPVRMQDYLLFYYVAECLMLERDADPDPLKSLTMTYMEYLFYKADEENQLLQKLGGLLQLCLGKKDDGTFTVTYGVGQDGKHLLEIGGKHYNSTDFDEIRNIIAEQNVLELADERIQKTVRDSIDAARRYKAKINGTKMASLEDQIIALSVLTGWEMDKIYGLTIRKFIKAIKRANHIFYQKIYLQASVSGMVEFKNKSILNGWLADIDDGDKNGDVVVSVDDIQNKISGNDATN